MENIWGFLLFCVGLVSVIGATLFVGLIAYWILRGVVDYLNWLWEKYYHD